jgi:chromodomain-helicase-DNA-binding protein 1
VNGHASPDRDNFNSANDNRSESDLSEAQPAAAGVPSPDSADAVGSPDEGPELGQGESSDSSDNDAPDDGDFDAAGSPGSVQSNVDGDHTASASARPAPKRKAAQAIEDEFMRENPELYGLRRSVRLSLTTRCTCPLTVKEIVTSYPASENCESLLLGLWHL